MSQTFVMTNKGLALLAKMAAGELLEITSVRSGSGTVSSELLKEQTFLTVPKQEIAVKNISYTSDSECVLALSLSNAGLETGYTLKQIGIFANDPDEGEILYCIYQDDNGVNHSIPSERIVPGYTADWNCYLKFDQATTVNVSVDPANTISQEVMERYVNDKTSEAINAIPPKLIKSKLDEADIITTAGTGAAYTATVPSITELKTGVNFIMIPHTQSTTTQPTLNVNGLGAKPIRQPLTSNTGATTTAALDTWLTAGKPVRVRYEGTMWEIDIPRPSATSLYGTVPVISGGTGADNTDDALYNLGAQPRNYYYNVEEFGCTKASTASEIVAALPDQSVLVCDSVTLTDRSWNFPAQYAMLQIEKYSKLRFVIQLFPKTSENHWRMKLNDDGDVSLTGNWIEEGKISFVKLWENASPNSDFSLQSMSVPGTSAYSVIMIRTKENICFISVDGRDNTLSSNWGYSATNFYSASRLVRAQTDNVLSFTHCYGVYGQSNQVQQNNNMLIPLEIYGVKGVY